MQIRDAHPSDARALWHLAVRSKAAWGYDAAFMRACSEELFPSDLSQAAVMVEAELPLGFHTLEVEDDGSLELGHLFVDPGHWGRGIGRALMRDAVARAGQMGYRRMTIQGDPNARRFYESCGAVQVGTRPSKSIPGRMLPLFYSDVPGLLSD